VWNFRASARSGTLSDVSGEPAELNAALVGARHVTLTKLFRVSLRFVRPSADTRVVRLLGLLVMVSMHSSGRVRNLKQPGKLSK
jgi:hypothetical protein